MRYSAARAKERMERFVYRAYMTDTVQGLMQGKAVQIRYADIIRPRPEIDVDAIIEHVSRRASEG